MVCDIHLYKEKCVGGKWVAADQWAPSDEPDRLEVDRALRFTSRNYQLFGLLARGVRTEHEYSFEPRGLPFDLCAEIRAEAERWDCDGHSHSYLFLHELKSLLSFLQSKTLVISGMKNRDELAALRASISTGSPDWNLLFPYCKWGNSADLEEFTLEVHANFYVGADLEEIIANFDGVDGDNHRAVFFFDN